MITLDEARAHIGATVVYRPPGWVGAAPAERGVITKVGKRYVFVHYTGQHWTAKGQATDPADLTLYAPPTTEAKT